MATFTSRMGLTKPAGSEARSVTPLNSNSDLLDKFMPCILVNDGVTPPTGDLYDGALVKERTSGIIWEARKNGGGTYDKVYVRYPFHFVGYTADSNINNGTVFGEWGVSTFEGGKNSSSANIVSNKFVVPLKGIYNVLWRYRWAPNGSNARACRMIINSSGSGLNDRTELSVNAPASAAYCGMNMFLPATFNAGDTISAENWQNSGGLLSVFTYVVVQLVEPIQ